MLHLFEEESEAYRLLFSDFGWAAKSFCATIARAQRLNRQSIYVDHRLLPTCCYRN